MTQNAYRIEIVGPVSRYSDNTYHYINDTILMSY